MSCALCLILPPFLVPLADDGPARVGQLDIRALPEVSGLVASRRYPGVFWAHSDSGNPPKLFAIRRNGRLIRAFDVGAPNLDWEDLACDDQGRLYLGDIGNNGGVFPVRIIYRLDEPCPDTDSDGPLPIRRAWFYRFADGERRDAEALYVDGGRLMLVTKRRDGREAELFALRLDEPASMVQPAQPERLGTLPEFVEPATGASITPDGRLLAVCSYEVARVYQRTNDGAWRPAATLRYKADNQVEAIAWDGLDLILVGERGGVDRVPEALWRSKAEAR